MPLYPPPLRNINIQHPVLHRTMPALAYVANLNLSATSVPSPAHRSSPKAHRIPHSLPWQPSATLRIPKIAELPQLFLRRSLALMSRRCTTPAPPAPQRKPPRMQPLPILQFLRRHKKWTSHLLHLLSEFESGNRGLAIVISHRSARQSLATREAIRLVVISS
jgi:hypothetical protein